MNNGNNKITILDETLWVKDLSGGREVKHVKLFKGLTTLDVDLIFLMAGVFRTEGYISK